MQPVIVIGMHRSGTSLVTSALKKMGVFIGNDLDDNNESAHFNKLNRWIFFQAGATWDNPYNCNFFTNDFTDKVAKNLTKHLSGFRSSGYLRGVKKIQNYKSLQELNYRWGWKDPQNTFTLDIWQKLFPNAKIIHVYRNPIDVAVSLKKREEMHLKVYGSKTRTGIRKLFNEQTLWKKRIYYHSLRILDLQEGIKLWEQYIRKAISYDSEREMLNIGYEDFLLEPEKQIERLAGFISADISTKQIVGITKTINSSRRFAFVTNPEYLKVYEEIKERPLLKKLGYDKISAG